MATSSAGSPGGGGSVALPKSCKAIHSTVTKDLGLTLKKVEPKKQGPDDLECNFYDSAEGADNGAGYISVAWSVMKNSSLASMTFDTVAGMTFGDEKSANLPGLGDKAVALTDKGEVVQLNVLSGRSILTVGQLQYDTPIVMPKWTALATALLAWKA